MLDLAVNVWPAPRSAQLQAALQTALRDTRYPNENGARAAVAARHGRTPEEVLLANGACELFWLLAHTLRPRLAACIHPCFTEPEAALLAVGAHVLPVRREPNTWRFDPGAVPEAAELVMLGNPNNPTGNLEHADTIRALRRPGRLVVVDESFMEFVVGEPETLAAQPDLTGLAVVRSLTKLWSLAGIRAGYLLATPELVERLSGQRQPWSVNTLALAALTVCSADRETPLTVARQVAAARAELSEQLRRLGLAVWPSAANFLLLRVEHGARVIGALGDAGVAVRPCSSFPGLGRDFLRVAVRQPQDNAQLVRALERVLA